MRFWSETAVLFRPQHSCWTDIHGYGRAERERTCRFCRRPMSLTTHDWPVPSAVLLLDTHGYDRAEGERKCRLCRRPISLTTHESNNLHLICTIKPRSKTTRNNRNAAAAVSRTLFFAVPRISYESVRFPLPFPDNLNRTFPALWQLRNKSYCC